ncbi:aminoglycoside phosphotransferase [Sulfuricella denitrificans skB26]|uniref:Aminoglycoside phosphotransferase n=1 Tax=Sulfuricella denitrificans (strain DSM 22764 / NBRC 105220 / skB26) TaxID=1163617 RepID=S6AAY2_SULDS|nr:phosphotransferase [Sulfuricella denitrificans]BAN36360.1 aminoglycoside phosphotransferase [Sulfuricella denitrificans skB26]
MDRLELLENWLKPQFPGASYTLAPASADASFRRYFRVSLPDCSLIVMDAPPEFEDCRPFIHVAELLRDAGVRVPHILAQDLQQGFLLLTDLGSTTYLDALNQAEAAADTLYAAAAGALINIQLASRPAVLPDYNEALLLREMRLFPDWYVSKHLQIELTHAQAETLGGALTQILQNNLSQPKVFVHRDYHSRNLMVDGDEPGILDFQDAVYGPITYDLVSLFKDAYVHWEEERVLDWTIRYWEKAKKAGLPVSRDFAEFYRDFEWMGVQRHIKVLGIFARLCHRDGKENYLKDMPLVMAYLRKVCERYRELGPLLKLLDELEEKKKVLSPELKVLSPANRCATFFSQDSALRTQDSQ